MLDSSDQAKNTFFERITLCQARRKKRHLPNYPGFIYYVNNLTKI